MRELTWFTHEQPPDDSAVKAVEKRLAVQLPPDFRAFAKLHAGSCPNETDFRLDDPRKQISGVGSFLKFTTDMTCGTVLAACASEGLSPMVVPIAETGGGDLVCLDYRPGGMAGVVYWHHERQGVDEYTRLADTFTSFLDMLYEPNIEDESKLDQPVH